jgi:uncharacterized membrane protein YkvI
MDRRTWGWLGPVCGILFVIVATVAVVIAGEMDDIDPDDPARKIARELTDKHDDIQLSFILFGVALFFLLVFLGYLRDYFGRVSAEGTWLVSVFWAGALAYVAAFLIQGFAQQALFVIDDYRRDPVMAKTLYSLGWNSLLLLSPGILAMAGAAAILTFRHRVLPMWLGALSILVFIGAAFPWIPLFPLWVLLTSIVLLVRMRRPAPVPTSA